MYIGHWTVGRQTLWLIQLDPDLQVKKQRKMTPMELEFSRVIRLLFAVTWSIHTRVKIKSPTRNHIILRKRQNNGAMEIRLVKKRGEASSLEKCSNHKACSP